MSSTPTKEEGKTMKASAPQGPAAVIKRVMETGWHLRVTFPEGSVEDTVHCSQADAVSAYQRGRERYFDDLGDYMEALSEQRAEQAASDFYMWGSAAYQDALAAEDAWAERNGYVL